jgi:1-deoxy-D-xylulose-5-phosphate synthase
MVQPALAAAEELNATVIDMRFVKPLDADLIGELAATHQLIVTVEENTILGGAGSAVNEFLLQENHQISVLNLGLPDKFLDHGKVPQMLENAGLDSKSITKAIQTKLQACKIQSEAV